MPFGVQVNFYFCPEHQKQIPLIYKSIQCDMCHTVTLGFWGVLQKEICLNFRNQERAMLGAFPRAVNTFQMCISLLKQSLPALRHRATTFRNILFKQTCTSYIVFTKLWWVVQGSTLLPLKKKMQESSEAGQSDPSPVIFFFTLPRSPPRPMASIALHPPTISPVENRETTTPLCSLN